MTEENERPASWNIVKALSCIVGLVVMFYALNAILDDKIDKRLNDPTVTKRIAEQVRPFAIFSGTGTVLVDNGAMEYVADLTLKTDGTSRIPAKVIVVPKHYMAHAPLITAIDQIGAVARPKRGKGVTWEYTFAVAFVLEPGIGPEDRTTAEDDRYRLEIIK